MGKNKKKKEKNNYPVETAGHDLRAEKGKKAFERESDAPDGVTGNWS